MTDWLQLIGGGILLYFGAEWFVGGASALALSLRVPQLLIGLTVVAYGTSAPEIIVGVQAAIGGHGDVALGNVLGSNIANVGLILGVAALIHPAGVDGSLRSRELPVLLLSAACLPLLLLDGRLDRVEAGGLLFVAFAYTGWMVRASRHAAEAAGVEAAVMQEVADAAGAPETKSALRAGGAAALGLAVLLVGGHLFLGGAVNVARGLGMSDRLVGLTIVALGTSLPELITSIVAARRGHSDLAVGNVVGSNIFNIVLCLGASGLARPFHAPMASVWFDLAAMLAMTVLAAVLLRRARTISRLEGGLALALYVGFLAVTVARG